MQAPQQRCARLIAALEDLVAQEAAALRTGNYTDASAIEDRCAPLVDDLVAHADEILEETLRERLRALNGVRARSSELLGEEIARMRGELDQTEVAQRRAAAFAPVYGGRAGAQGSSQLSLVG